MNAGVELSPAQSVLLARVLARWWESQAPVSFAVVDKELDRQGYDAAEALVSLPAGLLRRGGSFAPQPDEQLVPTAAGLGVTDAPGVEQLRGYFMEVLRFLVQWELEHQPTDASPAPTVSSTEVTLGISRLRPPRVADPIVRALGPLLINEPGLSTSSSLTEDGSWSMTLSREIRAYRGASDLDEYLARRAAARAPTVQPRSPDMSSTSTGADAERVAEVANGVNPRNVFVVHGRDLEARDALLDLLRDLDLHPIDWEEGVAGTGRAAPYIGDTVGAAFRMAQAVIVLLTPDDEARLHPDLAVSEEDATELQWTGQPRPNVFFEAGMALATHQDRTVLVEIGKIRRFSDVAGRHTVKLTDTPDGLNSLRMRLESAGCTVNTASSSWMDPQRFAALAARTRRATGSEPSSGHVPDEPSVGSS